ncbi:MAG: RecQ family ATP-dependent DNA helicase, partial [Firmicutes bacterium]|nr:RecQ family ATP-dependent DNA helicase [Bacillota bacterium]
MEVIFFDTEVKTTQNPKDGDEIADIGAVSGDGREFHSKDCRAFASFLGAPDFLVGHNIIEFDCKYLQNVPPVVSARHIDTLYWSPILFAQHPYHRLLKDDKFESTQKNNPLNDSLKAKDLFFDEVARWEAMDKELQQIYAGLLRGDKHFVHFFDYVGFDITVDTKTVVALMQKRFVGKICTKADLQTMVQVHPVQLAYAVAQIEVMIQDANSITPPWVLKQYPEVENFLQRLKGTPCGECAYCTRQLSVVAGLRRWFGYDAFRTYDGQDLQREAAECAINGQSLLAVFPTGGGKSITFQLPALMQGETQKGLTIVISPLQSLQKDQVDNLENKHSITKAVRLDGSLDPIERAKAIERVENGSATLLYLSPESLRSRSIFAMLTKRNILRFVIDEAHCFSAWGQDFRTDYLYIAEFILELEKAKDNHKRIPVSCFTATAKEEVIADIVNYFKEKLHLDLQKVVSTAGRHNLAYHAIQCDNEGAKNEKLRDLLTEFACPSIVYVSRTKRAYELSQKLKKDGFDVLCYHGQMERNERTANQDAFSKGKCNIMVATKAFGVGVDKDNVGLVVHYDVSTSLEDYLQEAGRAGRDAKLQASCFVLYNDDDFNKHFAFLNQTQITRKEISQVWSGVKKLTKDRNTVTKSLLEVASAAGWDDKAEQEIGTRVGTAVNALEQVYFVKRGQNMPKVFATSLLVDNMIEVDSKLSNIHHLFDSDLQKEQAKRVLGRLLKTRAKSKGMADDNNQRIDFIAKHEGLTTKEVVVIVDKLRECGLLADAKDLYGFLQKDGGKRAKAVLNAHKATEEFLIQFLDGVGVAKGVEQRFNVKQINEKMQNKHPNNTREHLNTIFNFYDIKRLVKRSYEHNRDFVLLKTYLHTTEIQETVQKRLQICDFLIVHLYDKLAEQQKRVKSTLPSGQESEEVDAYKIEFGVQELKNAYNHKYQLLGAKVDSIDIEDALYYLKRIGSLDIDGGFLVIYNKMTLEKLQQNTVKYTQQHYEKLALFYNNKRESVHFIAEYIKKLSQDKAAAQDFVRDYFVMKPEFFRHKHFAGRERELAL